jgi:hypothetical protein
MLVSVLYSLVLLTASFYTVITIFPGKTEVEVSNGAFSIHKYGNSTKMKFALTAAKGLLLTDQASAFAPFTQVARKDNAK